MRAHLLFHFIKNHAKKQIEKNRSENIHHVFVNEEFSITKYIYKLSREFFLSLLFFCIVLFVFLTSIIVPLPISDKDNSLYSITITGGWMYVVPDVNVFKT